MVAGRRAFSRETSAQTMAAILEAQPPALATTGKQAPAGLENVIAHCLEKNPQPWLPCGPRFSAWLCELRYVGQF